MKVEIPGVAMSFSDLPIGGFFRFDLRNPEYGYCVTDGARRGAIILSTPERPNGPVPWLAIGGLPQDAVVLFPHAVLRTSPTDISNDTSTYGHLISAGGGFYMRARESMSGYRTFNVETGQLEQVPGDVMAIAYSKWSVGLVIDDRFEPIFSFPLKQKDA